MLNITKLYCGVSQPADALRYGEASRRTHAIAPRTAAERKPIVVWNLTRRCNLKCLHCYSDSDAREYPGELTFEQCRAVVDDLANFAIPGLLLSGGEPLIHPRFFDIAGYARQRGLRLTLSTNGTLIDHETAQKLKAIGFAYIGISLDGIGATHDYFRGRRGAFEKTVQAFRHCKAAGQKVGLRLTLSRNTIQDLDRILDFVEQEDIDRVCFYHLVYSGRGVNLQSVDSASTRGALDKIMDRTAGWARSGRVREVLTVDQPADGAYLYLRVRREDPGRAAHVLKLLQWNGGGAHGSGIGIGNIDTQGNVHPDQFWQTVTFGNVKERPFSDIWSHPQHPTLLGLRDRLPRLKGRCRSCAFLAICGGGFRVRAAQVYGDPWAPDPGCHLTDEEIKSAQC
ncbi:MAG: radical SAM protein [Verrucomicrobia subdivision 3 bacterium]|nr:radical SAM protein [Limisphaerales bacterium]